MEKEVWYLMVAPSGYNVPRFGWSVRVDNATPFSSSGDAETMKRQISDATAVIQADAKSYVVKIEDRQEQ